jgi:pimeloyl-ACP methyl ester carboxylesterase
MGKRMIVLLMPIVLSFGFSVILHAQEGQSGKKHYDLFLKTSDSWKMINKELTVPGDFHSDNPKDLPGKYFHGALLKKEIEGREPGPVTFHVNYPAAGSFIFFLETVSDTGILKISLDHKKLKTFKFMTGPAGKGPWVESRSVGNGIFQCDYNKEYSVKIPAGKHDIEVQNMGTDWLSIGYFVFSKYSRKMMSREYEDWKAYKSTLAQIDKRLEKYKEKADIFYAKQPGDINYDLLQTLKLQMENFDQLSKKHASVDFNLMRTEKELKEIFDYAESNKDYFKLKRGKIKAGYLSEIDSTYQPYDLLIPQSYDPAKKYALVLLLHGYQNEIHKYSELAKDDRISELDSLGIIKVALYGRRNHYYLGAAEEDVLTVMNMVQSKYSIDPDRIYLTGSSMGGYGTWFIGLNYPDFFAAVSPVCPPSIFSGSRFINTISPIEYISNAQHLPARIYHGAADSTVNVDNSRQMAGRLKELNYDYVYTEFPGVGHDSWNKADADKDRLPWLLKYTRNSYPDSVRHKVFYLRYGKAYWLQITGKKDWNKFAEIRGEITGKNGIHIQTENISSFFVDLKHPALSPKEPLEIVINRDSIALNGYPAGMDFYLSKDSVWVKGKSNENGSNKKQGLEGPFNDVETGSFLLVYGTGNAQKSGMLKKIGILMQNAYAASDMDIKLVPDTLVIQNKLAEKNNLYLIGSPDENNYLKEIISGLPISFGKDSLEFNGKYSRMETGIKMIYPNPKQPDKYVIIDTYPQFLPDIDQLVNFPVADYLIYSLKGGRFEILKDEFFGPDWQVIN